MAPYSCVWPSPVPRSSKQIKLHPESQRSGVNTLGSRILAIFLQQACFLLRVSNKVKLGRACCQPWCCCLVCGEGHSPHREALLHAVALVSSSLLLPQFSEANEVVHSCRPTTEELKMGKKKRERDVVSAYTYLFQSKYPKKWGNSGEVQ